MAKRKQLKISRDIFKEIKYKINRKDNREKVIEFETALRKLIKDYDTSNWENRFVVGGALEVLFCSLLNSLGFKCIWLKEARYDLNINDIEFSLKSNFTGSGDIRLINVLGDKEVKWDEPTLFFISDIGVCYVDPKMNIETSYKGDALTIKTKDIIAFVEKDKNWLLNIKIPRKSQNPERIKTASYSIAKSILEDINSKHLKVNMPPEN